MASPQSILGNAAKANDLFDRLLETTDGAIKTRESLFAELKAEIDLHTRLEQTHLLPALRKHAKSRDLAEQAAERLRGLHMLLARLGREPMEGDAFPGKIKELKKAFQAHVRDDKSELLPAVKRALSDEEAKAVVEKISAGAAAAEKTDKEAAEARRAEARLLREQAQARQAALDAADRASRKAAANAAGLVRAASEAARAQSSVVTEVMASGVGVATELARKAAASLGGAAEELPAQNRGLVALAPAAVDQGVRKAGSEWVKWARTRANNQTQGFVALLGCRTPQQFLATQTRLIHEDLALLWESSARIYGVVGGSASLSS